MASKIEISAPVWIWMPIYEEIKFYFLPQSNRNNC